MASIRIHRNGSEYGPYTVEDAQRYLNEKNLLPEDLAWTEGMTDWARLDGVIARLAGGANPQTPPPIPISGGQTDGKEQFQKVAGQAYDVSKKALEEAGKLGGKAIDEAGKLIEKAGPAGQKVREQIRGKEKIVGGAVAAIVLAAVIYTFMSGAPSASNIREALQRESNSNLGMRMLNGKFNDVKVMNCKKQSDSSAYRCEIEVEVEVTNPLTGLTSKEKTIGSENFIKGSDGWRITR